MYNWEKTSQRDLISYTPNNDEEPAILHIVKSGSIHPQMYLVIFEDAFDALSIKKLTQEQLETMYKIKLN